MVKFQNTDAEERILQVYTEIKTTHKDQEDTNFLHSSTKNKVTEVVMLLNSERKLCFQTKILYLHYQ